MNRQLGICVSLVLTCAAGGGTRSIAAQEIEKRPATRLVDLNDPGLENQAVVDEIREIRKLLGDGIAERLEGLDLGKSGEPMNLEQVFNRELDRLSKQTSQSGGRASSKMTPPEHPAPPDPAHVSHPIALRSTATDPAPAAVRLRRAARRLEEIAADLEDVHLFQDADEIREQARKFWNKARQFDAANNLP